MKEEEKKDDIAVTGIDAKGNTIQENVQVLRSEEESDDFRIPSVDVDREGWFVICGITPENGISQATPLGLKGINSLVIADLDYFVKHNEEILGMVKKQIENRNYFREHTEEWEEYVEACRRCQPFQRAFNQKLSKEGENKEE